MTLRITERDRRTLIAGVVAVAALLVVGRGRPAWHEWDAGTRAAAVEARQLADRARQEVAALPALRDSTRARQQRLVALAPAILEGRTAAAAGATLASLVSGAASSAGVELGPVEVMPDTASGTFARIAVRASATGDLAGVVAFVKALEAGPELLAVREWAIEQPLAGGPADQPEALRITLTVEGISLRAAAADGASGDGSDAARSPAGSASPGAEERP